MSSGATRPGYTEPQATLAWCSWGATPRPVQAAAPTRCSRGTDPSPGAIRSALVGAFLSSGATRPGYIEPKGGKLGRITRRNPFTHRDLKAIFIHLRLAPPGEHPLRTRKFLPAL